MGYLRFIGFSGYDESFRTGLREPGYVVGQNLLIEVQEAGGSNLFFSREQRIVDLGVRHRCPRCSIPATSSHGGLVSYGADLHDLFRRAASYVDKILRGRSRGRIG